MMTEAEDDGFTTIHPEVDDGRSPSGRATAAEPVVSALRDGIPNARAIQALKEIAAFGRKMPGHGYSCATMAIEALEEIGNANLPAQGMEAEGGDSEAGSVHDSPVPEGNAPQDIIQFQAGREAAISGQKRDARRSRDWLAGYDQETE